MEQARKLRKLLCSYPSVSIYGNEGDYSKYKLLKEVTSSFEGKEYLVNRYLKDKCNIVIYPGFLGQDIFAICQGDIIIPDSINDIKSFEFDWVYIPGNKDLYYTYVFYRLKPNDYENKEFFNIMVVVFVESFPFGKKDFCDSVMDYIEYHGIVGRKKVVFIDEDRKYGFTDISDVYSGREGIVDKLNDYVDDIGAYSEKSLEDDHSNIKKQYIEKKRVVLERRLKRFQEGYDTEYEFYKQRYFCDEEKKSILSDFAFEKISDYKMVKGADCIEKKMFDNLIIHLNENKEDICLMIRMLFSSYLIDLKVISENEISKYFDDFVRNVKENYKYGKKEKCPVSKLEYRVVCSNNQYVIRLRRYLEDMTDKHIKNVVFKELKKEFAKCKEKYYEEEIGV